MILFARETGAMFSDIYGYEGSKELRTIAKKMRLDRTALRDEGHPVDEHYLIPSAKHAGMAARGIRIVSPIELREAQDGKRAGVERAISGAKSRPMTTPYVPDEAWQPPSFTTRREDRRKDWRQEIPQ